MSRNIIQLSNNLHSEISEMKGFSSQNLKYMRKFAEEYDIEVIGQQAIIHLGE